MSYKITVMGKVASWYPTFSSEKRAWGYIIDQLKEEQQDAWDMGDRFDFDHALSFYGVVKA